jgi:HAD superfamily hydrolase (TIGR01509 family)
MAGPRRAAPRHLLLDVAGTLLVKERLHATIAKVLHDHGHDVDEAELARRHKLLSEVVEFPDETSREFYTGFNSHVLRAFGIVPSAELLHDVYDACRRLPWAPAPGAEVVFTLGVPVGVVSNWGGSLFDALQAMLPFDYSVVVASSDAGVRKPDPRIFAIAADRIGCEPADVAVVGDSFRLDVEPALAAGMAAVLVDPLDVFRQWPRRCRGLDELPRLLADGTDVR